MVLPDAEPQALLDAFLQVHAQDSAVPAALFARGEELHRSLTTAPPAIPAWGRFLVALGHLAAESCDDPAAASRYFLQALKEVDRHGDHEAAVTAGYDQGVLQEKRGNLVHARAAYRAAASEGFRLRVVEANTLRAAAAAVRLHFAEYERLDAKASALAKSAWLGWLWLRRASPERIDADLASELGRLLAALLLPEDDPAELAPRWRAWPPSLLSVPDGSWHDHDPACLVELFAAAAVAADQHLADEGAAPGEPYRILQRAALRSLRLSG
ncbi:MAG: hypothetical protein H0V44_05600 [Planctomycetes bacterium]|nr:hypothetical protein [Planctomycetota bacterium]